MRWVDEKVVVLLPARDEAMTIRESLVRFNKVIPQARLIVIDNNSSDETAEIAITTIDELKCDGEVLHAPKTGKGNALRSAFSLVDADAYLICDADLTYPIEDAPKLLDKLFSENYNMVVGERLSKGDYRKLNKRRFHYLGNELMTALVNLLFTKQYRDVASGFRALNREFIDGYTVHATGFDFEIDVSVHAALSKAVTLDLPVSYYERPKGSLSKLNTYSDGWSCVRVIFSRFFSHRWSQLMRTS